MASLARFISCLVFLLFSMASPALPEMLPPSGLEPIQDQLLRPSVIKRLNTLIANDRRPIHLVIVPDRKPYGGTGSFTDYVDALAENRGIHQQPLAILLVHEINSKNIALRLGRGYSAQNRHSARTIIARVYQQDLQHQRYNQGYPKAIATLIKRLPKVEPRSRSTPSSPIALNDNGALIQDHVGTIVPNEMAAFASKLAARLHKGQMLRLLVIQRHQDLNDDRLLAAFANKIFAQWGMNDLHNAILVLYEAQSNTAVLRLGYGFSHAEKTTAFQGFNTRYKPLLRQHKFNQAHQEGMLALLEVLGKPPAPVTGSAPAQVAATAQPAPATPTLTPAHGADRLVSPHNTGEIIQDSADVLTPAALNKLTDLIQGFKPAPIRILTVKNYLYRSNSKDFQTYANRLFSSWQLGANPTTILIVHDVKTNRIAVAFGTKHSRSEQTRLRDLLQTAYAPGLRQGLLNAAHIMGIDALLKAFNAPIPPPVRTRPKVEKTTTPTPPKSLPMPLIGLLAILALIALIGVKILKSRRKSTAPRRARAARISAWKQIRKTKKPRP